MIKLRLLLIAIVAFCTACTSMGGTKTSPYKTSDAQMAHAAQEAKAAQPVNPDKVDTYYDFEDVLVPREMEMDDEKSLVFDSPNLKAGMMYFEGRVNAVSLFDFFVKSMPNDGWQSTSSFKYGRYIIGFEKPDKDCIISITQGSYKSSLQIWVSERKAQATGS